MKGKNPKVEIHASKVQLALLNTSIQIYVRLQGFSDAESETNGWKPACNPPACLSYHRIYLVLYMQGPTNKMQNKLKVAFYSLTFYYFWSIIWENSESSIINIIT